MQDQRHAISFDHQFLSEKGKPHLIDKRHINIPTFWIFSRFHMTSISSDERVL
jgi:hypothetical protein